MKQIQHRHSTPARVTLLAVLALTLGGCRDGVDDMLRDGVEPSAIVSAVPVEEAPVVIDPLDPLG